MANLPPCNRVQTGKKKKGVLVSEVQSGQGGRTRRNLAADQVVKSDRKGWWKKRGKSHMVGGGGGGATYTKGKKESDGDVSREMP